MLTSTVSTEATQSPATPYVDAQRILRAIASSTAIETGQPSQEIERQLSAVSAFAWLELAAPVSPI
ncbi:hypothetical protein CDEF62S_01344 [Castellaniella defragrans]